MITYLVLLLLQLFNTTVMISVSDKHKTVQNSLFNYYYQSSKKDKIYGSSILTQQQRHKLNLSLQASTNVIITKQEQTQQNKSETFEISL